MVKNLPQYLDDYLCLRVSLGYASHPQYPVREFVGYLMDKYPQADCITKELERQFDAFVSQVTQVEEYNNL